MFSENTRVVVNSTTVSPESVESGGFMVEVEQVLMHPAYHSGSLTNPFEHDIALLKLSRPVNNVPIISLVDYSFRDMKPGTLLATSGWGYTEVEHDGEPTDAASTLQQTQLKLVSNEACQSSYEKVNAESLISDNMLCAYSEIDEKITGTCQGDSGGPLVYYVNNTAVQVGIVSFGYKICGREFPNVFVNVSRYRDFIEQRVGKDAVDFISIETRSPNQQTESCKAPLQKEDNSLDIACLIYNNTVYQTDLFSFYKDAWRWSGELKLNDCQIDYTVCASVDQNLNLSLPNIAIDSINYRLDLQYDAVNSRENTLYWDLKSFEPEK